MAEPARDADGNEAQAGAQKHKPARGKRLMLVAGLAVLLAGGGGGAWFFWGPGQGQGEPAHGEQAKVDDDPIYLPLEPAMVVNFKDPGAKRFLQLSVQVMARDPEAIEVVKRHMPHIRNNLVLLFSNQSSEDIATRQGKERLRAQALEEVKAVLASQSGEADIEAVYFTNFVMQ